MYAEQTYDQAQGLYPEVKDSSGSETVIRRKLAIGGENDPLEEEADIMADKVMRMPDTPVIQRRCSDCRDEEQVNRKPAGERILRFIQSTGDSGGVASEAVANRIHASRGGGNPLQGDTRTFMESRFGTDFSGVRIHIGEEASHMACEMNAQAFTVGKDIYFNFGRFSPGSSEGRYLLAHELTHTIQQDRKYDIQRKIRVNPGLKLDTQGFTTSKSGDTYTCPKVTKSSVWNEIFSSLLHTSREFKVKGTTNTEVNENLENHMIARMGIIDFASKKQYVFAAGSGSKVNPKFWNSPLVLKPGVDRQKALEDLNVNPKEYAIACLAATTMTVVGGGKSNYIQSDTADSDDWTPGDWGYIRNNKFSGLDKDVGLEGENLIYVGKDKFWGHFTGSNTYRTFQEWFDEVESWNGEAETLNHRRFPLAGLD